MEKNQIVGLIVMMLFITVYFTFFAPDPAQQPQNPNTSQADSLQQKVSNADTLQLKTENQQQDTTQSMQWDGDFATVASGSEEAFVIQNKDIKITFSNKGGIIQSVELLNYQDFRGNPLILLSEENAQFSLLALYNQKEIDFYQLYYTVSQRKIADTTIVSYKVALSPDRYLEHSYQIPPQGFNIEYTLSSEGINEKLTTDYAFIWTQKFKRLERDIKDSRTRSTVQYKTTDGEIDYLSTTSEGLEQEEINKNLNWIAFKQKFFTSAIISYDPFSKAQITSNSHASDTTYTKLGEMKAVISSQNKGKNTHSFRYYFGPNDYEILQKMAPDFEENVDFGWSILAWINIHFIRHIFSFLEGWFSNYGVIILIMVIIVRLILSPLTYKSHLSMAKMRVLKPELDEIKEKHGGNMQNAQKDQMELYRKVGINPLSGCIPMILQMPILFALFYFFPNAIELRQQGFLWATDLSTYDNVLDLPFTIPFYGSHVSMFTLLMTVSTILYTWSNSQITTVSGPMKTMQYFMPLIFLFFLNSFSSGLTFYYFVSNMSTFGQTFLFRKLIDEQKIRKILEENKKKNANKKKSKFQLKLEEAMKASQEAKKNKRKRK